MSELFQNIMIGIIGFLAIVFLVRKFVWYPKKKNSKSCGSDGCGC
ncbi:MAG: FeoB-associated Cys-rich membrane protein [Flavobacteriaceae bacterium]|nr:FeoB-associated Cys-rich membrane protein [Flavobacteriaceae bacterium]